MAPEPEEAATRAGDPAGAAASDAAAGQGDRAAPGRGPSGPSPLRGVALAAALVFALAALPFLGTLGHGFPLDDEVQVERNLAIRRLDRLPELALAPTWPGNLYRPVASLSYALTYAATGLDPRPFHLGNVVLHGLATALLFLCLTQLVELRLAFATSALFAVLPIHVEAVASIANRTELFAAGFSFLCLWALLRAAGEARRAARLGLLAVVFVAGLAALLSKESALCLVLLAPLCLWLRARSGRPAALVGVGLGALSAAIAAGLALRAAALGGMLRDHAAIPALDNPLVAVGTEERWARAAALLGRYFLASVAPVALAPDHSLGSGLWVGGLLAPGALAGALAFGALLVAAGWRRRPAVAFFAAWFLAAFAATANALLPIGTGYADRLAYLPSVGACGLLALLLLRASSPRVGGVLLAILVAGFALQSAAYARVWRDSDALFAYAAAVDPGAARVQSNRGETLRRAGQLDEATARYEAALRAAPGYAAPRLGLALIDLERGDPRGAAAELERAIAADPLHGPSLVLLGRLELARGDADAAGRLFVRALNADNGDVQAKLGILLATLQRGNLPRAAALRAELEELVPDDPDLRRAGAELDRRAAEAAPGGTGAPRSALEGAGWACDARAARASVAGDAPPCAGERAGAASEGRGIGNG